MTTSRMTTNSVLDSKLGADQVGIAASLGHIDTTHAISRAPTIGDMVKTPPVPEVPDDFFSHKELPPTRDPDHHDTVLPLPDPVFGVGDGVFPIEGTNGPDVIDGTEQGDIINAEGGSDNVYGNGGHDTIDAGDGHDYVSGDAGNDFIIGGTGDDWLDGDGIWEAPGDGNDFLDGGSGDDKLYGKGGDDMLFSGSGEDELDGGSGDDTLVVDGNGRDDLYGGTGADAFLSLDDIQQHDVWDYSAAEGDTVDGDSWLYVEGANWTAVFSEEGNPVFLLRGYNAEANGINLVQYNPEPAA
jgi:hypothetical protein